jgi:hypothetical protein
MAAGRPSTKTAGLERPFLHKFRTIHLRSRSETRSESDSYTGFVRDLLSLHDPAYLKTAAGLQAFRAHKQAGTMKDFAAELCDLYIPTHPATPPSDDPDEDHHEWDDEPAAPVTIQVSDDEVAPP